MELKSALVSFSTAGTMYLAIALKREAYFHSGSVSSVHGRLAPRQKRQGTGEGHGRKKSEARKYRRRSESGDKNIAFKATPSTTSNHLYLRAAQPAMNPSMDKSTHEYDVP